VVLAILRALAASARRDLNTYAALKTNNFFLFVALLIWGALVSVKPVSAGLSLVHPVENGARISMKPLPHGRGSDQANF
jgi:hypothetical protein